MTKLGIPVGVIFAFLGLAIALQTVVLLVEELGYFDIADRMMVLGQLCGQSSRALADPPQRRFRIATCSGLNQALQCCQQSRIGYRDLLSSSTRADEYAPPKGFPVLDFSNASGDRFPGQPASTANHRNATITQSDSFVRCHDAPCPLIQ